MTGSNNNGSPSKWPFPLQPSVNHPDAHVEISLISKFCKHRFPLSNTLIGFKQPSSITHSIEGQMSKPVNTNEGIMQTYYSGVLQSRNFSLQCTFVPQRQQLLLSNALILKHLFNKIPKFGYV